MKKQKISLKFLKKYQKESILAPLFKLLEALMDLTVPLVVAQIIKNGIGQNDMSYVLKMFGLLLLLAVLGMTFSFTAQWFAAKASTGYATIIAPNTINGLLNNRRKARFRPVCTCNTSLVIRVINVSVPS